MEDRKVLLANASSSTTQVYTHPNPATLRYAGQAFDLAAQFVNRLPDYVKHSPNVTTLCSACTATHSTTLHYNVKKPRFLREGRVSLYAREDWTPPTAGRTPNRHMKNPRPLIGNLGFSSVRPRGLPAAGGIYPAGSGANL